MVKTITKAYQTDDGTLFAEMDKAVAHEVELVRNKALEQIAYKYFYKYVPEGERKQFAEDVLKNPDLREALNYGFSPMFGVGKV